MANTADTKKLDELSANITELPRKICNNIIEKLSSTSTPNISEKLVILLLLKNFTCVTRRFMKPRVYVRMSLM